MMRRGILTVLVMLAGVLGSVARAHAQETLWGSIDRAAANLGSLAGTRVVAVLDFPKLDGTHTELGAFIGEELSTALTKAMLGRGRVVERRQVRQVLEEERLGLVGLTQRDMSRVAQKLGANAIVLGTITVLGSTVVVNVRLVDVASASLLTAERISGTAGQDLLALGERQIASLSGAPGARPQGDSRVSTPSAPVSSTHTVSVAGVQFQIVSCKLLDGLRCSGVVTSREETSLHLVLGRYSTATRAFDDGGAEHRTTTGRIADVESIPTRTGSTVTATLAAGVPTPFSLTFESRWTAREVALLRLRGRTGYRPLDVTFRHIPVSR